MMPMLDILELHTTFKNLQKNELIVDVRYDDEYAEGHIPGSKNISYEEVLQHVDELKKYSKVYLYCRTGSRVQRACLDLMNAGLKNIVAVVGGGMPDWTSSGFPIEK